MLTVEEAKEKLFSRVPAPVAVDLNISEALGYVLANDVTAPIDLPFFDQSAMDGYAVASGGDFTRREFEVVGEIAAGDDPAFALAPGQAARIFTGAALPAGADSIVIQEKVTEANGVLQLQEGFKKGDCIRYRATQIGKGDLALAAGAIINPASIGFLASLGVQKVSVYKKPTVSIVVTGNEVISADEALTTGKVYESNSFSLIASLHLMNISVASSLKAEDEKEKLRACIVESMKQSDVLLLTGGISVGKYDLVYDTLKELGVEQIFYKVAQKPGKPLFAGRKGDQMVFALPGNPASGMVCFYEYVYPSLRKMQGYRVPALSSAKLRTSCAIKKKDGRAVFIRGKRINDEVMELEGQDSNMMKSFAEADCFIYLKKDAQGVAKGEEVDVHLLPYSF